MGFTDFRDFSVWHKSIMLAKEVHRLSKKLPQNELLAYSRRWAGQLHRWRPILLKDNPVGQQRILSGFCIYLMGQLLKYRHSLSYV